MTKPPIFLRTRFLAAALALSQTAEAQAPTRQGRFTAWVETIRKEAATKHGIPQEIIDDALPPGLKPVEEVLGRRKVPKKPKEAPKPATFESYLSQTVTPTIVEEGRAKLAEHRAILDKVGRQYGVAPEIIVSLWATESKFGRNMGEFNVVSALATLAQGSPRPKRRAFFRSELFEALKLLDRYDMPSASLKGSWAGAVGQCQFMPSNINKYAIDGNGDGKVDLWNTPADVFASAANLLNVIGWKEGEKWGRPVKLPRGFNLNLVGPHQRRTVDDWNKKGIRLMDGSPIPPGDAEGKVSLIQPDRKKSTQIYIVYKNFKVLKGWNNSSYFAASVGTLADKIAAPAPSSPSPPAQRAGEGRGEGSVDVRARPASPVLASPPPSP